MSIKQALRPYQVEAGRAVLKSVLEHKGLTFTLEVARQGGKNELSAQLELLLLTLFMGHGGNLVKAAPTYIPQLSHSSFTACIGSKTASRMPGTPACGPPRRVTP